MKLLSNSELGEVISESRAAAEGGPFTWDLFYSAVYSVPATVSLPLGELLNERISGFVTVWRMKGLVDQPGPITSADRFNAQGLEGKVVIEGDLGDAVLVAANVPLDRVNVRVDAARYADFRRRTAAGGRTRLRSE